MVEQELKATKEKFNEFKMNNNLDTYFAKNLNDETRKRVLKEVEDLNKQTDFNIDETILLKCNEANVRFVLD